MSKMLKLLQKANHLRQDSYTMAVDDSSLAMNEALAQNEKDTNGYENGQNTENGSNGYHYAAAASSLQSQASIILIVIAIVLGFSALLISYKALAGIQSGYEIYHNLRQVTELQEEKIGELKSELTYFKQAELENMNSLQASLDEANVSLKQNMSEFNDLFVDFKILKVLVDDLKTTDRLILDKTISLNGIVKKLNSKILEQEEGRIQ